MTPPPGCWSARSARFDLRVFFSLLTVAVAARAADTVPYTTEYRPAWWRDSRLCDYQSYWGGGSCSRIVKPTAAETANAGCAEYGHTLNTLVVDENQGIGGSTYSCCKPVGCDAWNGVGYGAQLIKDMCEQWGPGWRPNDLGNQNRFKDYRCAKDVCPFGSFEVPGVGCRLARYSRMLGRQCPSAGDPVHVLSGNKFELESDLVAAREGGARFERTYNSLLEQSQRTGSMGRGWVHGYDRQVRVVAADTTVRVTRPDGRTLEYQRVDGVWRPEDGVFDSLEVTGAGYRLTLVDGSAEEFDAQGQLVLIVAANGHRQALLHTAAGFAVTDDFGRVLTVTYDAAGQVGAVADSLGGTTVYAYAGGALTTVHYADGRARSYDYSPAGYLAGITNESGVRYVSWTYDAQGRAKTNSGKGGEVAFEYLDDSATVVVTEQGKAPVSYQRAALNGVYLTERVIGGVCSSSCSGAAGSAFTYYPNGKVKTATGPDGTVTFFEWDSRGRETRRVEGYQTPRARTVETEYHPAFSRISKVTETQATVTPGSVSDPTRVTTYTYDPATADLLEEKVESGTSSLRRSYTYASAGVKRSETFGPTTLTYDSLANGLVSTITDNAGRVTRFTYDGYGRVVTSTDPNGVVTATEYWPNRKVKAITEGTARTAFDYDSRDRLSVVTHASGKSERYLYDGASERVTEVIYGVTVGELSGVTRRLVYGYDSRGEVDRRTSYDATGRLVRSETDVDDPIAKTLTYSDSANRRVVLGYDDLRRPKWSSSVLGLSEYLYDENGNLSEWTSRSSAARFRATHGAEGQTLSFTDPLGVVTESRYDGLGRISEVRGADWGAQRFSFFPGTGLLREHAGHQTGLVYDDSGRIIARSFSDSAGNPYRHAWTWAPSPKDQLESVVVYRGTQAEVETSQVYDARARLSLERTRVNDLRAGTSRVLSVGYAYSSDNQLTRLTYPSGAAIEYDRVGGLPRTVRVYRAGGVLVGTLTSLSYDAFDRLRGWSLAGTAFSHLRSFDPVTHNLTALDYPGRFRRELTYDTKDQITTARTYLEGLLVGDNSYAYDAQGRSSTLEGGSRAYDANGNVTQIVRAVRSEWATLPIRYPAALALDETVAAGTLGSLIGHWKLDEATYNATAGELKDSSGLNRHGRMSSTMTTTSGLFGRAFDTVAFPNRTGVVPLASLPPASESLTAQVWVRTTDRTPYKALLRRLSLTGSVYNGWMLQMGNGDGKVYVRVDTSAGTNQTAMCSARKATDPLIADGRWHSITVTLNDGNCKLYIDGVKYADGNYLRGAGFTTNADFHIIGSVLGQLDDVALWARPLTDAEVAQTYALTSGTAFNNSSVSTGAGSVRAWSFTTHPLSNRLQVAPSAVDVVRDGLLGYWKLDETGYNGTAGEAKDASGQGRHGTTSGGAQVNAAGLFGKAWDTAAWPNRTMTVAASALPAASEAVTAQLWIKSTDVTPWRTHLGRMSYSVSPFNGWILQSGPSDGKLYLRIDTSAGANQTGCSARRAADPVVLDGQWHHVAVVIHDGSCRLYVDGVKVSDGSYARGAGFTAASDFFVKSSASVDEVALWGRALSDAEVQQNARGKITARPLAYDADGRQVTNPAGDDFKYNTLGELEGFGPYRYLYDHRSMRVGKIGNPAIAASAVFNTYAYDLQGRLLGEYDKNGTPIYEVFYLGMTPIAVLRGGALYLIAADQADAPRVVFSASAPYAPVWRWPDDAFGELPATQILSAAQNAAPFEFHLRFPGQVFDKESGLHYNASRFYNPATGRYLQPDRIGLAGGANPYAYVGSSPLDWVDPDGARRTKTTVLASPTAGDLTDNPLRGRHLEANLGRQFEYDTVVVSTHGSCKGGLYAPNLVLPTPGGGSYRKTPQDGSWGSDEELQLFAQWIKTQPAYRPCGGKVVLLACSTGCEDQQSVARRLQAFLPNNYVFAPKHWVHPDATRSPRGSVSLSNWGQSSLISADAARARIADGATAGDVWFQRGYGWLQREPDDWTRIEPRDPRCRK